MPRDAAPLEEWGQGPAGMTKTFVEVGVEIDEDRKEVRLMAPEVSYYLKAEAALALAKKLEEASKKLLAALVVLP